MKLSVKIPFTEKNLHLLAKTTQERTKFHYGMGNRCDNGQYCVFLDYDDTPLEWVYAEIDLLQDSCGLGSAYVFQTKNGYHVCFLEKVYFHELLDIMSMTTIDQRYRNVPLRYGNKIWVLRNSKKQKKDLEYIGVRMWQSDLTKSNAHRLYLMNVVGVPKSHMPDVNDCDHTDKIILGYYKIA